MKWAKVPLVSLMLLSAMTRIEAQEQTADTKKDEKANDQKAKKPAAEKISVTGSRIKRVDVETVQSVTVLGSEDLKNSGASNVSEALGSLSVSSFGSYSAPVVNDSRGTVTSVNLRGLGAENTLVLLDGRRLPDEGGMGVVDLSTIPMAAVERIEILHDAASAIYGSDATGGVVNIITKKDFEGTSVSMRWLKPKEKGGEQRTLSVVSGSSNERYKTLTTFSYQDSTPIYYRDRDWTKVGSSIYSFPANYVDLDSADGYLNPSPNCPAGDLGDPADQVSAGGPQQCTFNYALASGFAPKSETFNVMNNFEYTINDDVSFFGTLRGQRALRTWNMAPNADSFTLEKAKVTDPTVWTYLGIPEPTGDIDIYYRGKPYGNREFEDFNNVFGANLGFKGTLKDWEWSLVTGETKSRKHNFNPSGWYLGAGLTQAILDKKFNPFATSFDEGTTETINATFYQGWTVTDTRTRTTNFAVSSELGELPGGKIGVAFGVDTTNQTFLYRQDQQSNLGNVIGTQPSENSEGDRNVTGVYAEAMLPVIKDLEVQLAARHDSYSDFGSTTNPKLGVSYKLADFVKFRGNVSNGFRAPTLKDIFGGKETNFINMKDLPRCRAEGTADENCKPTTEVKLISGGNQDLKQEISRSYNLGMVLSPTKEIAFTFDFWHTVIENKIANIDNDELLKAYANGKTVPGVKFKRTGGELSDSADGTKKLEELLNPLSNVGKSINQGWDTAFTFNQKFGTIQTGWKTDFSRRTMYKEILAPGGEYITFLDKRGIPKYRYNNELTLGMDGYTFLARTRTISSMKDYAETGRIGEYTEADTQLSYKHAWNGEITIGAMNVFERKFPLDFTQRAGDDQRAADLYDMSGRKLYLQIDQTF